MLHAKWPRADSPPESVESDTRRAVFLQLTDLELSASRRGSVHGRRSTTSERVVGLAAAVGADRAWRVLDPIVRHCVVVAVVRSARATRILAALAVTRA